MPSTPSDAPAVALDAAQLAVAALPADASGVVVGAPGSGKTATLVARARRLLAEGLRPDELLVLTPTRQTATVLRDRLALEVRLATPGALARSVAAFAYDIVRAHAAHAGAEPPQLLTGADEDQIIADLLDGDLEDERAGRSRWPEWLPSHVRGTAGFRAEVRAFLAECTTLGIDPAGLSRRAADGGPEVWSAMASFASEYDDVRGSLRAAHRDAAGLVREALALVRVADSGAPALERVRRLRTILVDDAQELTLGGIELLEACRARGVAVLAFGDPDVGSGSFRGATPQNFARLAARVDVHVLPAVHRGTPMQRDLCAEVTSRIGAIGVVSHRQPRRDAAPDESVRVWTARSATEEYDIVARVLRERHVHAGVPWEQCAVVAHDARQVAALEAELAAREVPTRAGSHGAPLAASRSVRDLLRVVLLAESGPGAWEADDVAVALAAAGLDAIEQRRLRMALRHAALREETADGTADENVGETPGEPLSGGALLLSALAHPLELELLDTREARRAARVARAVGAIRAAIEADATAHELLWEAWDGLGGERAWTTIAAGTGPLAAQAHRELDAVVALFQAAKRHGERADGTSPLSFLRGVLDSDVAEDRLEGPAPRGAVPVLTPAGALGLEFDTVVVAGLQDGVWPNLRVRGTLLETWRLADDAPAADRRRGVLHDELRLFARAVSRARSHLVVTAVDDDDAGPSPLFDLLPPARPRTDEHPLSLRGMVAAHRRTLTSDRVPAAQRDDAAAQLALLSDAGVAGADPAEWYGIAPPTTTAGLYGPGADSIRVSPSRVERLEQCALDWVVSELGGDARTTVAGLGTIIHSALEDAAGADEEALWGVVESRWGELEFAAPWQERAERARARDLVRRLALYLHRFEAAGGRLLTAEPHFEVPVEVPGFREAILSGYIDRVEETADGRVVIVDLKTGKNEPQTDAKVADNAQLAAYQLALDAGAIPAAAELTPGGAKLLVLRPTAKTKPYADPHQPPLDAETRAAFVARLREAVATMAQPTFAAPFETHCRDEHSYGVCRIHTIPAVSAS
ncbi:ATP-dependent DNA helicase [Microbacterium sp. No. 7]|uniref:ATP-dependent DNA helicase n=1 Tax=Microbacterium sp. No. 7 TaxID=1714373 RepID=UPI0006D23DC1|nr:ATP-dependent DNA helicase [Microbacterium sp. No. 7]